MNENTWGDNKLNYLAYAILYSRQRDERTLDKDVIDNKPGTPLTHKGKWTITNWLNSNRTGKDCNGNNYTIKAQFTQPGGKKLSDYNYKKLDVPKGEKGIEIGNKRYTSAQDFVDETGRELTLNSKKTEEDKKNGYPRVWRNQRKGEKDYTVIGPYRVDIKKGLDDIIMKYKNARGTEKEISAAGYCTTVQGDLRKIEDLNNFSSSNKFYLVFKEEDMQSVESIENIKLYQHVNYIQARIAFTEASGADQNIAIFNAVDLEKDNTLTIPNPISRLFSFEKRNAETEGELENVKLVLKNEDTNKFLRITDREGAYTLVWVNGIGENENGSNSATRFQSGDFVRKIPEGNYALYEVERQTKYYKYCNWENPIKVKDFKVENYKHQKFVINNNEIYGYATVTKIDADTKGELKNTRFVLQYIEEGKTHTNEYVTFGKNTTEEPNSWSTTIEDATPYQSGDTIMLTQPGKYQFYEIQSENVFYEACDKTNEGEIKAIKVGDPFDVEIGKTVNIPLENKITRTVMKIKKVDQETGEELKNVRMVIKRGNKYAIGGVLEEGKELKTPSATWTTDINEAQEYQSGQSVVFDGEGGYELWETQRENENYLPCSKENPIKIGNTITLEIGKTVEVTVENKELKPITKKDYYTRTDLKNVEFVIQYQDGTYLQEGYNDEEQGYTINYTSDITLAKRYHAGDQIWGLWKNGTYKCLEVKRENESYEYASLENPIELENSSKEVTVPTWIDYEKDPITGELKKDENGNYIPIQKIGRADVSYDLENTRKYVRISGYVWEDKPSDGKITDYDNVYNPNSRPDKRVANVTVTLKDRNGNIMSTRVDGLASKKTDDNGAYSFREIKIDQLEGAYIEFTYNGICYQSIPVNSKVDNGSKATEGEEREEFNNKFAVITNNQATGSAGTLGLEYNKNGPVSTLKYGREGELLLGYEGQRYPVAGVYEQYEIKADTYRANPNLLLGQEKCPNIEAIYGDENTPAFDEIDNINLGIKEREQPDIGIAKDLQNVKINVNGKTHVYEYAQRFNNKDFTKDFLKEYNENGGKYYKKQDGEYIEDENGEYIKYQSIYSDEEYIPKSQLLFNMGVRYGVKQVNNGTEESYQNMTYRRAIYRSDYTDEIPENKQLEVYVTYKIKANMAEGNLQARINQIVDYYDARYTLEKIGTRLEGYDPKGEGVQQENRKEEQYNAQYKKLVLNTENIQIGGQTDLSNDDGCIYVQFKLNREAVENILIEDNLNEDNTSRDLLENVVEVSSYSIFENGKTYAGIDKNSNPGNTEPGDRTNYENDTDASPALQLEVADARVMTGKVFVDTAEKPTPTTDTNQVMTGYERKGDGIYGKKTNAPNEDEEGIEEVKVTLTETSGSGLKYETTTESNGEFTIDKYIPGDYILTYTWGDKTYTVQDYKGTIYLDREGIDTGKWWYNDTRRLSDAIDDYNVRKEIDEEMKTINTTNITREKMEASTAEMKIDVEYHDGIESYKYSASTGEKYEYKIADVDFGIVERAKQKLDISKSVTGIKVSMANGQVIVDAKVDPTTGTIDGQTKGVTYGPSVNGGLGLVKVEIDNEILQGATAQIEYTLTVKNNGEIDYAEEGYYKYGTIPDEKEKYIIKMQADVYDYLDNTMVLDENNNSNGWQETSKQEYNEDRIKYEKTTTETVKDTITERFYTNATKNGKTEWEMLERIYQELFTQWEIKKDTLGTRIVRDIKLNGKNILEIAGQRRTRRRIRASNRRKKCKTIYNKTTQHK